MNEHENDHEFPEFPLTGPMSGEDDIPLTADNDDDYFLTGGGDEEEGFLTGGGTPEEEIVNERPPLRPMYERVQPPPGQEGAARSGRSIPRPNRLDPNLLRRSRRHGGAEQRPPASPHPGRIPRPRKIATRRKRFAALYIFALMVIIAGCLTFFAFYFQNIQDSAAQAAPTPSPTPTPIIVVPPDVRNMTAQIVQINHNPTTMEVVQLSNGLRHQFIYTTSTEMTNIHGNPMVFEQLALGQLMDLSFDANNDTLLAAHQSRNAWERRNQTNLRFDLENDTLTVGNDIFSFSHHQTLVLYQGESFPIAQLQPINSVTLVGYGNQVWLIQLDAGHGFLQLNNAERVINGTIEVGTHLFLPLAGFTSEMLQSGQHRIVVNGQNIETFVRTIYVEQGETFIFDLMDVQLLTGMIAINTTPAHAFVFINGEMRTGTAPVELPFGEHLIRVESYGYVSQEQVINVTASQGIITVALEEAIRVGTIRVVTIPTNAQIFVNNQFAGHSELFHELSPGSYTITARLAGHDEVSITMDVVAGMEADAVILLTPTPFTPVVPPPPYDGNPFAPAATPPPITAPPPLS